MTTRKLRTRTLVERTEEVAIATSAEEANELLKKGYRPWGEPVWKEDYGTWEILLRKLGSKYEEDPDA